METQIDINKVKSIYFIGIGGIGMSAIAQYFYNKGCKVSGFDHSHSMATDMLENQGIMINYYESIDNIREDTDLVVYTPAINTNNVELSFAMNVGLPVLKRSEVLGLLCKDKYCIAVAGTHGKTTVTAMIANMLSSTNIGINAFVGGICKTIESNLYQSDGAQVVVVEADEFDRSFLKLNPDISVITSIDPDHLDIYGNYDNLKQAFVEFSQLSRNYNRIVNYKYKDIIDTENTYGFDKSAKYHIVDYKYNNGLADIIINDGSRDVTFNSLPVYGKLNVENFCAAFTVANMLKVNYGIIESSMLKFKGVNRRLDIRYQDKNVVYIDDYAHHPAQIRCLLDAIHEIYPGKKICGFFQPHLFSRTQAFMDEFAAELSKFDEMYLLDIYPARETPIAGITSQSLFAKMNVAKGNVIMKNMVPQIVKQSDANIFVTIGAGNIERLTDEVVEVLKTKTNE